MIYLRVNRSKTEYLKYSFSGTVIAETSTRQTPVPSVDKFNYLDAMLTTVSSVDADVKHRVNLAWRKWRILTEVQCNSQKTNGKVYKTAVHPTLLYGSEFRTVKKMHEQQLIHIKEMKTLRRALEMTKLDGIRESFFDPISEKNIDSRLRWYGHMQRRNDDHVVKIALNIPEEKRRRGHMLLTWWSNVASDKKIAQLPEPTTLERVS